MAKPRKGSTFENSNRSIYAGTFRFLAYYGRPYDGRAGSRLEKRPVRLCAAAKRRLRIAYGEALGIKKNSDQR